MRTISSALEYAYKGKIHVQVLVFYDVIAVTLRDFCVTHLKKNQFVATHVHVWAVGVVSANSS